jgi:putative methionine-R-sulfoxide reductase with GAF domain
MSPLAMALRKTVAHLAPHQAALTEAWIRALRDNSPALETEVREFCTRTVASLLDRLSRGELEALLHDEAEAAAHAARIGASFHPLALAIRLFDRCCLPFLLAACTEREALAEALLALDELGDKRLEVLLRAQEDELHRHLVEVQEDAARTSERARQLALANDALRRAQTESQRRADQIGLLNAVTRRIAAILEPERLMQEAAETIQAQMNYTYVAVVVVDADGALVGRWAARPGVDRRSAGRTDGPPRGIIGRAIRKRAPQVVGDVSTDPDYHADVAGTCSEMAIPLFDGSAVLGALDFQSEARNAFDLDHVAVGEILSEFVATALRNARRFAASQGGRTETP